LERNFLNQKAVLLEDLDTKLKTIIQKGNVELLKVNLPNFNAEEVPNIYFYVITLNSEFIATEMVKALLANRRADPGAGNNKAILAAVEKGYSEIVRLLVEDPRTDPSVNNDEPLKTAHKKNFNAIKDILLTDFRVDASSLNTV